MAPAPVIEGSLKNTINSLGFGLIVSTLGVNFGKLFVQNFFPYMIGLLIFVEALLFSLDKPKEGYDKYQPSGIRGRHTFDGSAGSPQITVSGADQNGADSSPKKRDKIKDKKAKKDQKGTRGSGVPTGSPVKQSQMQSLSVPSSPGMQAASGDEQGGSEIGKEKSEKEKRKEEEKEKKKEKEEEKERQKAEKERMKESEDEKSGEKGGWRKWKVKKQASE